MPGERSLVRPSLLIGSRHHVRQWVCMRPYRHSGRHAPWLTRVGMRARSASDGPRNESALGADLPAENVKASEPAYDQTRSRRVEETRWQADVLALWLRHLWPATYCCRPWPPRTGSAVQPRSDNSSKTPPCKERLAFVCISLGIAYTLRIGHRNPRTAGIRCRVTKIGK